MYVLSIQEKNGKGKIFYLFKIKFSFMISKQFPIELVRYVLTFVQRELDIDFRREWEIRPSRLHVPELDWKPPLWDPEFNVFVLNSRMRVLLSSLDSTTTLFLYISPSQQFTTCRINPTSTKTIHYPYYIPAYLWHTLFHGNGWISDQQR